MNRFSSNVSPQASLRRRGSAILLALWAILVMTGILFLVAREFDGRWQGVERVNAEVFARARALSGIELGMQQALKPGDPRLIQTFENGERFEVELRGEGGRLNPNWLAGDDLAGRPVLLENYLIGHGADYQEAKAYTAALLDYIDADDLARINGIEEGEDYAPRNAPLMSLDEMLMIPGSDVLARIPGWRDDFTLHSAGRLDVHWASRSLLLAVPGIDEAGVDRLIARREERELADGTELIPGEVIASEEEMLALLGVNPVAMETLGAFLTTQDPTRRVVSRGEARGASHQIEAVFRAGNRGRVLEWNE